MARESTRDLVVQAFTCNSAFARMARSNVEGHARRAPALRGGGGGEREGERKGRGQSVLNHNVIGRIHYGLAEHTLCRLCDGSCETAIVSSILGSSRGPFPGCWIEAMGTVTAQQ